MEQAKFQKIILQTLAFWDMFEHPLTKEELYHGLCYTDSTDYKLDYVNYLNQLEQLVLLQQFEQQEGFYFLAGRGAIVAIRQNRIRIIEDKMKIAKRGIRKLSKVPFVRAVFVCNTLAMGVSDEDSDIDVLVIVKNGRLWLARLLATIVLSLFGLRRTKNKIKDKICLSFYLADNNLNLEKIAIQSPDIYLMYWINNLIPVYDPDKLHSSMMKANSWVKKFLPNGLQAYEVGVQWRVGANGRSPVPIIKNLLEKFWGGGYGDLIENQAKGIQQAKMKRNYLSLQNVGDTRVVVNDQIMKFHETDRREEYRDRWVEKCQSFLVRL